MLNKRSKAANKGTEAESLALHYLQEQGLTLIERNFRVKQGELDLIMMDSGTLVFVEVRYRRHRKYGTAAETVNYHKQQKLLRAANMYLMQKRLTDRYPCRFDVVTITHNTRKISEPSTLQPEYSWYQDAFAAF